MRLVCRARKKNRQRQRSHILIKTGSENNQRHQVDIRPCPHFLLHSSLWNPGYLKALKVDVKTKMLWLRIDSQNFPFVLHSLLQNTGRTKTNLVGIVGPKVFIIMKDFFKNLHAPNQQQPTRKPIKFVISRTFKHLIGSPRSNRVFSVKLPLLNVCRE